ncbi:MAG TPA: mucoidy inhibitor MuiA family protein [Beijerinckiaceae bacterium]|nr:mucoidy inhibitor MuiA family protein [Beijerinckiaceae bacterium]
MAKNTSGQAATIAFFPCHAALLASAAVVLGMGTAHGAEIEARSRIQAVTVFPDAAIVTRSVPVELEAGSHVLVLRGLPASLDPASLRIEGKATGALSLGAVDMRLVPIDPAKAGGESEARLKAAREERDRLAAILDGHEGRKAMIQRFAQSGPERGESAEGLKIDQWASAWATVGEALVKVNEDVRLARRAVDEAEAKLKAAEQAETGRRNRTAPERDFTVALEAGEAVKAELTLSYRVSGAGWRPGYDARLATGVGGRGATLSLSRRAVVTQRTGEDWSDVEMALSTVRAFRGTAAPDVIPQRVGFYEPPMPVPMARQGAGRMAEAETEDGTRLKAAAPPPMMAARPMNEVVAPKVAEVESGDFQTSYRLPGKVSLAQDGTQKSFIIHSREIAPDLLVRSAPALDPSAYLEASFINQEDAPLLAGEVNLIRDGSYVGKGRFGFVAPGEKAILGFGADDRVKVMRVPVRRKETDPMLVGTNKTDTREFKITVRNLHDMPIKAEIVDQMPYSEMANLTVEPLNGMTQPTEKSPGDRRGVMVWAYEIKPKEEKEIRLGYRLRWPSDREISFTRVPVPK